ncbi:MAG: glycosyltransferase [Oscillospiraceae bacterium]
MKVGIMNDAFPPTVDGTATTTFNYANILNQNHCEVMVIVPKAPKVVDNYPYEVFRYDAFQFNNKEKYQFGWPFRHKLREYVWSKNLDLLHFHCPIASGKFARIIRDGQPKPIIATYHTKYDYDIRKRIPLKSVQNFMIKFIVTQISAADEVWVVSPGAGENLRSMGYKGDYIVMPNGVDFSRGKSSLEKINRLKQKYDLKDDIPTFLFVGRLMWYKNIKITLDALKLLSEKGQDFRFIMIGLGTDKKAIEKYIHKLSLNDKVIETGMITDRDELKTFYSVADAFLFPSTFDSHGLVVREAAACDCPSLLIKDSSAAFNIIDGENGYLADEENAESFCDAIIKMLSNRDKMKKVGKNASQTLYLSWTDAVKNAYERYKIVYKKFNEEHNK